MSEDDDQFKDFNLPQDTEQGPPESAVPDLKQRGFFAPEYEEAPAEMEAEKEPHKGKKVLGGVLSIISGGVGIFFNFILLFLSFLLALVLLLIFPELFFLYLTMVIVGAAGAILALVGGIVGLSSNSRSGAIIALLGNLLLLIGDSVLYYIYFEFGLVQIPLLPILIYTLPFTVCGIIGGIILLMARRTVYYVD